MTESDRQSEVPPPGAVSAQDVAQQQPTHAVVAEQQVTDNSGAARAQKALEDLAKNYRDQFAASTARTGTTLLSWLAALLILLVSPIVPLIHQVTARARVLRTLSDDVVKSRREFRAAAARVERGEATRSSIASERSDLTQKEQAYGSEWNKVQKIKTPLGDIEVPAASIPPLYSVLLAGFVGYLLHRRLVLNAMALRVVHLHIEALQRPKVELRGFGAWAPFWLAPLPPIRTEESSRTSVSEAEEARLDFLGWRTSARRKAIWLWLIVTLAALVWLRVILLARSIDAVHAGSPSFFEKWQTHAMLFVLMSAIFFFYVRPVAIWGAFPEQLIVESRTRRAFLGISFVAIAGLFAIAALPRSYWRFVPLLRSPRFRRRKRQLAALAEPLRRKLVTHRKSHVIRYVDDSGWLLRRKQVNPKNLTLFTAVKQIETDAKKSASRLMGPQAQTQTNAATFAVNPATAPVVGMKPQPLSASLPNLQPTITHSAPLVYPLAASEPSSPNNVVAIPAHNNEPEMPKRQPKPYHLERSTSGTICERLALQQISQNLAEAMQLVWTGILIDSLSNRQSPNYRLYELFVGLAHRSGIDLNKSDFSLAQLINTRWQADARLQSALARLQNPSKQWSQRWKAANLRWAKPSTAPQKHPKRHRTRQRRFKRVPSRYNSKGSFGLLM